MMKGSRTPEIMADAAYAILCRDPALHTGNFYIDEDVSNELYWEYYSIISRDILHLGLQ